MASARQAARGKGRAARPAFLLSTEPHSTSRSDDDSEVNRRLATRSRSPARNPPWSTATGEGAGCGSPRPGGTGDPNGRNGARGTRQSGRPRGVLRPRRRSACGDLPDRPRLVLRLLLTDDVLRGGARLRQQPMSRSVENGGRIEADIGSNGCALSGPQLPRRPRPSAHSSAVRALC